MSACDGTILTFAKMGREESEERQEKQVNREMSRGQKCVCERERSREYGADRLSNRSVQP
jgi:hypothetical protein